MDETEVRVVLVGDSRCGKTTLLSRFTTDSVPAQYAPTSFDKVTVVKAVGGRTVRFTVWDTSGAHSFDTVRPLSYGEADIFVICCRPEDPASLAGVLDRWAPEVASHAGGRPVLVAGCGAGEAGRALASQVGAAGYCETRAGERYREVGELFTMAAAIVMQSRRIRPGSRSPPPPCPEQQPTTWIPHSPPPPRHHPLTPPPVCPATPPSDIRPPWISGDLPLPHLAGSQSSIAVGREVSSPCPAPALSLPTSPAKTGVNPAPQHSRSTSQPAPRPASALHCSAQPAPRPVPALNRGSHQPAPALHSRSVSQLSALSSVSGGPGPERKVSAPGGPQQVRQPPGSLRAKPPLPKSPTELLQLRPPVTAEPRPRPPNYESLKSHTSTASHGSTGSKISSTSSQSAGWAGPRPRDLPDTEDPTLLGNLQFTSPKAGVYRPVTGGRRDRKERCSLM